MNKKIDPYRVQLTPHEVEELINFGSHGLVFAGDTISHSTAQSLIDKGLASRIEGRYCLSSAGQKWFDVLRIGKR